MIRTTHRPKRSLGQNFLQDQGTAAKIVASLDAPTNARVLEIGPGQGALTRWLNQSGCTLHALEKDADLAAELKARWPDLSLLVMDALEFPWERLHGPWNIIGNLPYNVASPIIWDVVSRVSDLERGIFMVQKEVADRIAAIPGNRSYGALSVWVQSHVQVRRLFVVGPHVFYPRPKIDSAVIRFLPLPNEERTTCGPALRKLLNICFQQRRKQLKTILRSFWHEYLTMWLIDQGLKPECRPEELSPKQFQHLAQLLFAVEAVNHSVT
ncbi:16S rRNA (adenine1518-N6/adenine1519-N6)-dimethyltransferase [Desulfonatronum thiosulfatophilum]|uniref:Ribosomal RNA small subunit methyltransferase A n=1 Tax=Desulfonatronum thiosulfatophilum TaxID=617002 RepID=A0A1G6BJH9_9BACT|nr:16S rRNA (adenine(1518)-N(6)/adenine(1519)-N(6))-dimethyltransferase RsmA [Desulfonatronum thiosulfatophilum]SDB20733.1 16S rRNA (adenine1518-N6/adenine1519-N6)-dimethyltransferase [Desulfonatronum thiosulfatophilum]